MIPIQPYRLLFPLGWIAALAGSGLWVIWAFGGFEIYPSAMHTNLMVGGFLFTESFGFLMTALPRFTGTWAASAKEIWLMAIASAFVMATAFIFNGFFFHGLLSVQFLLMSVFALRRFFKRAHTPPPPFIFVGLGLLCGLLSNALLAAHAAGAEIPEAGVATLRGLYLYGVMLCFVAGIGSVLIPSLLGWRALINIGSGAPRLPSRAGLAVLLFASFPLEHFVSAPWGIGLRALALSWLIFPAWKIHRRPPTRSFLTLGLRISSAFLLVGIWLPLLAPDQAVHAAHLFFIGGFGLTTQLISTRVILAHGGHNLGLEQCKRFLIVPIGLLSLSAVTRVVAPWVSEAYAHHLAYAAILWIAAWVWWGRWMLPRLLASKS